MADEETRAVIHAIRNEQHTLKLAIEMQNKRIEQIETMTADHIKACAENKAQMAELMKILEQIKGGMKVTTALRNAFLWIVGLATSVATIWQAWKG